MRQQNTKHQEGFTILELIIATSVFSLILLIVTTGIIHIGRIYYKGITSSRTQDTTRSIVDSVSNRIQVSGNTNIQGPYQYSDGTRVICIGTSRYSYVLDSRLSSSADQPNPLTKKHALWTDVIDSSDPCFDTSAGATPPVDLKLDRPTTGENDYEMLGNNMRLYKFDINHSQSPLYGVTVKVAYGADDLFDFSDPTNPICRPFNEGGQFCAMSEQSTFVKRRL